MTKIFLAASGWFGSQTAEKLKQAGHTILAVSSPDTGRNGKPDLTTAWARRNRVEHTPPEQVRPSAVPNGCDLILAAHSHTFVGAKTRARAAYALGYHPSLLPLHRGRDAVKWQARLNERVVGGTVYHLTDRVDGGPIATQRHLIVPPGLTASRLWRDFLAPLGLEMLLAAADAVGKGSVPYAPQDDTLATWEPSFNTAPLYRPELLEIEPPRG